jgi:hypothetical protein
VLLVLQIFITHHAANVACLDYGQISINLNSNKNFVVNGKKLRLVALLTILKEKQE